MAILENIRDMIHLMGIQALAIEARAEEVIHEHGKVLEALKQGNAKEARKAMEYHLDRSREAVLERQEYIGE
jgi:DNA-binding FadR family transcriptional regulator